MLLFSRSFLRISIVAIFAASPVGSISHLAAQEPLIQVRVQPVDELGNPLVKVPSGTTFYLDMYASDLRTNPEGVFSAYSDLLYDAELLETTGPITFAQDYAWARTGDLSQAGVVDEAGAIYAGISNPPPNTSEQLILRIPMQTSQQDGFGSVSYTHLTLPTTPYV